VKLNSVPYALKRIVVDSVTEKFIIHEINLHREISKSATFCLRFVGAYCRKPKYLVLTELMEGGSFDKVIHCDKKSERFKTFLNHRSSLAVQIAAALVQLHVRELPIVHRDLKPGNIFLDKALQQIRLGDFGLSHVLQKKAREMQSSISPATDVFEEKKKSKAGTVSYKAPEVWNNDKDGDSDITIKSDIYSFGIILHEMWTGTVPWGELNRDELLKIHWKNNEGKTYTPPPIQEELEEEHEQLANLIKSCLKHNPRERPTAEECLRCLEMILNKGVE